MEIRAATVEISMEGPQKIKRELPYDPAVPFLGVDLRECKSATMETPAHLHS
jgi:hypothetical protein